MCFGDGFHDGADGGCGETLAADEHGYVPFYQGEVESQDFGSDFLDTNPDPGGFINQIGRNVLKKLLKSLPEGLEFRRKDGIARCGIGSLARGTSEVPFHDFVIGGALDDINHIDFPVCGFLNGRNDGFEIPIDHANFPQLPQRVGDFKVADVGVQELGEIPWGARNIG